MSELSAGQTVRIMFDTSPFGMCSVLADGTVMRTNPAFRTMLGEGVISLLDLLGPADRPVVERQLRSVGSGAEKMFRYEVPVPGAGVRWMELTGVAMHGGTGDVMVHALDVTDRRRREDDLREKAEHDQMTGLFNRGAFRRALEERLAARPRGILMVLDLDGFKAVNDTRGHECGDQVLIAVAKSLRESVQEYDVAARLGGDEFALLLDSESATMTALGTMIIRRVSVAAAVAAGRAGITASIGYVRLTPGADVDALLGDADRALYAAKRSGKARCVEARPAPSVPVAAQAS